MKKIIILLITLSACTIIAGDAGQESPFTVGAGARALGMGGGFTSIANDASLIYYNPAGLPNLNFQQFSLMHVDLFEGTTYNFAGWVYPDMKLGGFGIGFFRIGTDDIIKRSNFSNSGTFDYSNSQFVISYGRNIRPEFSMGLSFKIVNQTLDSLSDYGIGIDLGLNGKINKYLNAGLILRDIIPPELELSTNSEIIPITISGGLGLISYPVVDDIKLNSSFELEKIENRNLKIHTGAEIILSNKYSLRSGYDRDNFAFGAGIVLDRFTLDYSYKVLDYIDDSHRFTFSFLIGSSIEDKRRVEEQIIANIGSELLEEERYSQFEFYKEKADDYHRRFMLDSASAYYQRALAFEDSNTEIIGIIAGIERSIKIQRETEQQLEIRQSEINLTQVTILAQAHNFFEKNHYNAALDMLQLILDVNPSYIEAILLQEKINNTIRTKLNIELQKAISAEQAGDNLTALTSYSRILEIDAENKEAHEALSRIASEMNIAQQLNAGIKLYNSNKKLNAKKTFEAVLTIDRKNPIAIEYLKKLNLTEVKPTTLEDLQHNKEVWQLYLDGLRYMRNKEYQKAIDAWNKVLKDYPNNINTLNNLEQALLRLDSEKNK